jgi:hypothetical protein
MDPVDGFLHFLKIFNAHSRQAPLARRGPRPRIGRWAVLGDVRMTIQAGLSEELWSWLQDQNWRELTYTPDRRRYREIPPWCVTRLIDCAPQERVRVLSVGMSQAQGKPTAGDLDAVPAYVSRQ